MPQSAVASRSAPDDAKTFQRLRDAHHEAGHAVFAFYFVGPSHIDRVELLPLDIERGGHCEVKRCFDRRRVGWTFLAGRVAELMYLDRAGVRRTGLDRRGLIHDGAEGDFDGAYRALVDEAGPSNDLDEEDVPVNDLGLFYLRRERRRVRAILAQMWPRVEAVAGALLEAGALDGNRLWHLLEPFPWPKPTPRYMRLDVAAPTKETDLSDRLLSSG